MNLSKIFGIFFIIFGLYMLWGIYTGSEPKGKEKIFDGILKIVACVLFFGGIVLLFF